MIKTAVVILNWNGTRFLRQFLPSVVANSNEAGTKVFVADNGSSDDSIAVLENYFPEVGIIRLDKNYGFAEGYNRALAQVESEYFLLLNSDIEVPENWIEPLSTYLDNHPEAAAVTPKILDYNNRNRFEYAGAAGGFIDKFGYPFCRGRIFDQVEEDHGQYDTITPVFWGSGACLLVRAELYRKAGGLDNDFFAHMEEIDLCWRLKRMGYEIIFHPGSKVWHVGGGTLHKSNPVKTYLNFRNNLYLLYKNVPASKRRVLLFKRTIFDLVSAARFLIRPDFSDFKAVIKAHVAFQKGKKNYRYNYLNEEMPKSSTFAEIYPASLVLDFFFLGRKTFGLLRKHFPEKMRELN